MTSHDVRDVLNLPQDGSAPRPTKKAKSSGPRPNLKGLAREVQNLGGDNPIAIVPQVSVFKKKRFASRKPAARWELRPFKNSARDDTSLFLRHWRRKTESEAAPDAPAGEEGGAIQGSRADGDIEDSAFAKYNVHVVVPQYSEDQYNSNLNSTDWTKDETDYLLDLVRAFDLRWPLIWDRYEYQLPAPGGDSADGNSTAIVPVLKPRSMEDLKARYYEVAAKMMAVQKPVQYMTQPEYSLHETMANFNPQQEKLRKEFAVNSLSRSKEEAREEESLLLEVKRILARTERINEERRELYARLDYPHTDQDISAFKSSQGLQTLLQNLMNLDKSKKRKSLIGIDGVSPGSAGPGQPPSATDSVRRESIAASAGGHRDSIAGADKTPVEPPKNNKKGAHQPERRKLSAQEEQVYGVSHHDRLASGATFRFEKVNKLFSQKSGQQQLRITNVLNELDIPSRLVMPTASIAAQFEQLVIAVNHLVDMRKMSDKLDAEVKIEEQRKLERDKAQGIVSQVDGAPDEQTKDDAGKADKATSPKTHAPDAPAAAAAAAASAATETATEAEAPSTQAEAAATDTASGAASSQPAAAEGDAKAAETVVNGDAPSNTVRIKEEDAEKEKSVRPGSSGAHKRSASVLSTTSDKSAKRQKK